MAGFTLSVDITPSLSRLMSDLRGDVEGAMTAGMKTLLAELEAHAVEEAPVDTSNLVNSISGYVTDGGMGGVLKATAPYAVYVHEGTRPHVIEPRTKQALYWPGARHPVMRVNHPGTKADPFFTRASRATDMPGAYGEGLKSYLARRGW